MQNFTSQLSHRKSDGKLPVPDKETEILLYLHKNDNISGIDLLNAFGDYPETHRIIKAMLLTDIAKLTSPGDTFPLGRLTLTTKGYQTALAEEDRRNKLSYEMANEKARQKSERRFQILNSLISAVAGSILTLTIEHFWSILEAFRVFIQWLSGLF